MTKYITTPIYYVNDEPHLGHSYTNIASDVYARFYRLEGESVKFLTGTDEHGQKVAKSAEKAGCTPQEICDKNSANFRELTDILQLTNDDFIRTTEARHKQATQHLWQTMLEKGHIYLGKYEGWYAVRDEAFYGESELVEKEGKKIAPTGAEVEWVEEPSYFFNLSKWQEPLLKFYEENPDFVYPKTRMNEVVSFVKGGLNDLSVSRTSFDWGIDVPGDENHIMYVWIDALTNYMTALGYPENTEDFQSYWPVAQHMVGKDILRFHAVYWPAFLLAAGMDLPKQIIAHGWWTIDGEKMSKSLGNVVKPAEMIETYGLDAYRYFLMREVPFGQDGDFSKTALENRVNSELCNDIGNLVQRVCSMVYKHCDQAIPQPGEFTPEDQALLDACDAMVVDVKAMGNQFVFHKMLERILQLSGEANRYVDAQAPWALRKTDMDRMKTVLYVLLEAIRHLAIILQPFTPNASAKILDQLMIAQDKRDFSCFGEPHRLQAGVKMERAPEPIFPRIL